MNTCELSETLDVELYFYDECAAADRARVSAHLRDCAPCRQRLDDLHAIRAALASAPVVDAPPAGDWSGFMRRLDLATEGPRPSDFPTRSLAHRFGGSLRSRGSLTALARAAAIIAVVTIGASVANWFRTTKPVDRTRPETPPSTIAPPPTAAVAATRATPERALRDGSAEHLERSKLVVLGLATRNPQQTRAADWQFERQLAGTLLPETRLYRLTAQEHGVTDVARVMRDLETVLLEASMTDGRDRQSLERVQRLIARRGLVSKMQIVTTSGL
jgi:hypothetical protein